MRLKDIADKAGVSAATVSNVINGNHDKVSADNIKRIQALIQKYNYVPKASARNLVTKSTQMIGVIIPGNLYGSGNPHNAMLVSGLEQTIKSHGYYLLLRCSETMESAIATLTMWDVDGAVILGYLDPDMELMLKRSNRNFPIVLIDNYVKSEYSKCMIVRLNDYRGGYLAGQYLTSCGHKNVAFVGTSYHSSGVIIQRFNGFRDALKEQGLELNENAVLEYDTTFCEGIKAGKKICDINNVFEADKRITAVFASSDIAAVGILEGLNQRGVNVPSDLSIIGFDNANFCMFTEPKLTTIGQDINLKAELAANLLIKAIGGAQVFPPLTTLDPELIKRGSVCRL